MSEADARRTPPLPCLDLYYGGAWHKPLHGGTASTGNPATGREIARVAEGDAADAAAIVAAAKEGFKVWRQVPPLERAATLRKIAGTIRQHADELAMLEAINCGNPLRNVMIDMMVAAATFEFFAGLVTEMKGDTIPVGPNAVNLSVREPRGVVTRIVAFNHPLMFVANKSAAPLAAGNAVIVKPAEQAPLSALRLAELIGDLLPPGVFNVVPGNRDLAAALVRHPDVAMAGLVGSVPTGRAVLHAAADTIKPVTLELGGKNALIARQDVDPVRVARAVAAGMNFNWCGQSCGSTSRAFLHEAVHDDIVARLPEEVAGFVPGDPTDLATTMGALISRQHHERVLGYIDAAQAEGATMLCGGAVDDAALAGGYFVKPTIFVGVEPHMKIASEEVFGPVLCVQKWTDEARMLEQVNALPYGLTGSVWTNDISAAHRLAASVEAGQIWINDVGHHVTGAPFGGYKQSGLGREGGISELLSFTEEKNIYINLAG